VELGRQRLVPIEGDAERIGCPGARKAVAAADTVIM